MSGHIGSSGANYNFNFGIAAHELHEPHQPQRPSPFLYYQPLRNNNVHPPNHNLHNIGHLPNGNEPHNYHPGNNEHANHLLNDNGLQNFHPGNIWNEFPLPNYNGPHNYHPFYNGHSYNPQDDIEHCHNNLPPTWLDTADIGSRDHIPHYVRKNIVKIERKIQQKILRRKRQIIRWNNSQKVIIPRLNPMYVPPDMVIMSGDFSQFGNVNTTRRVSRKERKRQRRLATVNSEIPPVPQLTQSYDGNQSASEELGGIDKADDVNEVTKAVHSIGIVDNVCETESSAHIQTTQHDAVKTMDAALPMPIGAADDTVQRGEICRKNQVAVGMMSTELPSAETPSNDNDLKNH